MNKIKISHVNKVRYIFLFGVIAFGMIAIVGSGGGGGSDGSETQAWVRIDEPEDGSSTGSDVVIATGNAAMRNGSYPDTIYWDSDYSSGVASQSVMCLVACVAAWEATIPLTLGENTITVIMSDGSDEVTITRYTQVVVTGRITMDETSGASVPNIPVILTGTDTNYTTITDVMGNYSFSHIMAGTYTITPSQPSPPQSSACLTFAPSSREITVPTDDNSDIVGQNFIATQVTPCYSIGGRVTASTNPGYGLPDRKITLSDQAGNEMVRYTDETGNYIFSHFEPGTYTLTPSYCVFGSCASFIPAFREVTIIDSSVYAQDFLQEF